MLFRKPPDESVLEEIRQISDVLDVRKILSKYSPTRMHNEELNAVLDRYWQALRNYGSQDEIFLILAVLNARSSQRQFIAAIVIALGSFVASITAVVIAMLK